MTQVSSNTYVDWGGLIIAAKFGITIFIECVLSR